MSNLRDMISMLSQVDIKASDEVQVGDGMGGDPLVGQLAGGNAQSWQPHDKTIEEARALGFACGIQPFYQLSSPGGRVVGFPFPGARAHQLEAVDEIVDAFKSGKDVLFEAGTGFGKSPGEIGVVSQFKSAYLLIGRNDLVDQWESDFEGFKDIGFYKSRQRFDCAVIDGGATKFNCSQAKTMCNKRRKDSKDTANPCAACPYAVNRDTALAKPYVLMTLSLGLTIFKYMNEHPGVTKRDVLVIDECSELESEIMKFFEFNASTKSVFRAIQPAMMMMSLYDKDDEFYKRFPSVKPEMKFAHALPLMKPEPNLMACSRWAVEIGNLAMIRKSFLNSIPKEDEEGSKMEEACDKLIRMTQNMLNCMEDEVPHFFEILPGEDSKDIEQYTVRVSPLEARGMIEKLAAPFAERILYVSATTGSAEMFKAAHSYSRPLVKIEKPSGFPLENRRIYSMRSGNMSAKTQAADSPRVMKELIEIANVTNANERFNHKHQKGIIHTYNNKIADMVMEAFKAAGQGHRLVPLRGGGKYREQAMDLFKRTKEPVILVSPSAMLGLSLNDDLGRWQAIVKVPYAFLGDPSVVHRKDLIPGWYEWQTAKDMIQTFGRVVRSNTDWGSTYILDEAFSRYYSHNFNLFPQYIRDAIWQKD